jgi:hypothetical protein
MYLPWFMTLIIFFLVFIPSYAFARLWDTTWGNRSTGKDNAINEKVEQTMKSRNFMFIIGLIATNIFLTWAFVRLFRNGYNFVLAFMFIVFCPMIVQLICSFFFLFIVVPFRNLIGRPFEEQIMKAIEHNNQLQQELAIERYSHNQTKLKRVKKNNKALNKHKNNDVENGTEIDDNSNYNDEEEEEEEEEEEKDGLYSKDSEVFSPMTQPHQQKYHPPQQTEAQTRNVVFAKTNPNENH